MFDRIILTASHGPLKDRKFVLEDGTTCIVGRSQDCSIHIPSETFLVSRHHCQIDVAAPFVRVRDLGSLNGTYINGVEVGRRKRGESVENALRHDYDLEDGDELQVGNLVFRVEFLPPPPCAESEARDQENLWACECAL
jgi:pSer/pThr/pTyr-binding forkhead associated (FHA) protein